MIDYELLKKLCSARSVSGDEISVRDIILIEIIFRFFTIFIIILI